MAEETVFEHLGHNFKVKDANPNFSNIRAGQWVRICRDDPYQPKPNVVALVLSSKSFWRRNNNRFPGQPFLLDDHLLELATDGDEADIFKRHLSDDEIIEVVEKIEQAAEHDRSSSMKEPREQMSIVICLDGTWNENETQDTNVHRIMRFTDKNRAIMNYYSGVGVGGMKWQNGLDAVTGRGVFRTVRSAYTFVGANYKEGDRIFIFGFSRGAYAARHLAGMIARIGINAHPETGYSDYLDSLADPRHLLNSAVNGTEVHFLGLFDCVPGNQIYTLKSANCFANNATLETKIRNVAHAVSADERRWSFKPLIMKENGQALFSQRWFPGCHFDVGGDANLPLNNFALTWMLAQALGCGLAMLPGGLSQEFDPSAAKRPREYFTTKLGIRCKRLQLHEAKLVERPITREQMRKDISALTRMFQSQSSS